MTKQLLVLLALILLLAGCTDPEKVAKGRAIEMRAGADAHAVRSEADIKTLATATRVAIEERAANISISATAVAIADNEKVMAETQAERIERKEAFILWSGWAGVAGLITLLVGFSIVSIGGAVAACRKANLEARLVRIDKTTRTWPIMLDLKAGLLVDLETGERSRIDGVSQLDQGRLIISGQARTTGLLAQAATEIAKSTKSAQPGDMLPAIGQSVPMLDLPALQGPKEKRKQDEPRSTGRIDSVVELP